MADPRTARVVQHFEALTPHTLPALLALYAPEARFKDPFNDVQGLPAMQAIFQHMFDTLEAPRFTVRLAVTEGDDAFLTWDFTFQRRGSSQPWCIHGSTHLHFGPDGRVALHRDYWDAAEELYAKLPLLGALMRWLQRQLRPAR